MSIYTYPVIDFHLPSYVTGSWIPSLQFNLDSTGVTYDIQQGTYSILYNTVFFNLHVKLLSKGTATGSASIAGLPYSSIGFSGSGRMVYYTNMASVSAPGGYLENTAGNITLTSSTATSTVNLTDANFTDTSEFAISGYYKFTTV